jgi:hypothetical protein
MEPNRGKRPERGDGLSHVVTRGYTPGSVLAGFLNMQPLFRAGPLTE